VVYEPVRLTRNSANSISSRRGEGGIIRCPAMRRRGEAVSEGMTQASDVGGCLCGAVRSPRS